MKTIYNSNKKMLQKVFGGIFLGLICSFSASFAGQYNFEKGTISITLPAPVGQILAVNQSITGYIQPGTGDMDFEVIVEGFHFITSFMPDYINEETTERFREYYLETDRFPKAFYKGKITDLTKINFTKDGIYNVETNGVITVHGVTQKINRNAIIIVKGRKIILKTDFVLNLDSYKIRKPELLKKVFFKEVAVAVECQLKQ